MPSTRPATFGRVNRSIPNATESSSTSSGTTVSMIEPSIGEVFRQSVHEKYLAQHADQQRGADQPADIRPFDPLRPLPKQRDQRQQRRSDQRSRDHSHRMHVIRQHDIVKGIIQGPDHVARQKGARCGFKAVHAFRVSPGKQKRCPRMSPSAPGDAEKGRASRRPQRPCPEGQFPKPPGRTPLHPGRTSFRSGKTPPRPAARRAKAGNRARRDTQDRKREFRNRPCGQRIADK